MHKVLLIEDNPDIRGNVVEILELSGYEVTYASNGKEGLALIDHNNPPEVILTDVLMTDMGGHEIFSQLRSNPATSLIPVVFVTAKTEKKDIQFALNLGVDDYICKPFDPHELLYIVEKAIAKNKFRLAPPLSPESATPVT